MCPRSLRCPRCARTFPTGATVCPACHLSLEFEDAAAPEQPTTPVFESWDNASVDIVVSLLKAHGVSCLVRGSPGSGLFRIGPASFWRVFVRPSEEPRAQEILDTELGREEEH
jgi:hypothetical protein